MRRESSNTKRLLAIDPCTLGFGFAVLEGQEPEMLVDWGIKTVKGDKNAGCLKKIAGLIELYDPQIIVLENTTCQESCRGLRIQALILDIVKLALHKRIKTRSFSRLQIKKAFSSSGTITKYQIAVAITERFPELAPRLPRIRKSWMSEDERMSIFDAVALALCFYIVSKS